VQRDVSRLRLPADDPTEALEASAWFVPIARFGPVIGKPPAARGRNR
jgi:hypothetical protein